MKKVFRDFIDAITIKTAIIILFILSLSLTVGAIGYGTYTSWSRSNEQVITRLGDNLNRGIVQQVREYLHIPEHIIQLNLGLIENEGIDFEDSLIRNRFFLNTLDTQDDMIYSFSYGSREGEYYGARRNETGQVELMVNNRETGGNSWYYDVGDNGSLGEFIQDFGAFDPRTRAWYETAIRFEDFAYSPVYKHFVMNDLTISAAAPVKRNSDETDGVLGVHILLSGLNGALSEITESADSYAMIVERETGNVIANSLGQDNYILDAEGNFQMIAISETDNRIANATYEEYLAGNRSLIEGQRGQEKLYSMATDFKMPGVDWVVITAVPESLLGTTVDDALRESLIIAFMGLLISILVFVVIIKKLLYPMEEILKANDSFAKGDLTKRVKITRKDEVGKIGLSYNTMAERIHYLVNNLEDQVKARTEEIRSTNHALEENKDQLQLILDSAAEGIYGIDLEGNCTFVNKSALHTLGYDDPEELLGKNMHNQIHHTSKEGYSLVKEECSIIAAIKHGKGTHVDSEVFWKKDNKSFPVEYFSYPQKVNGKTLGAVVTFMDITHRKKLEQRIRAEKEKFRTTLLSVGDGVISTDSNGKIVVMNPVAEHLTKWSLQEAKGQPFKKVFHIINEYTGEICENPVNRVLESMEIMELAKHITLISKDGTGIPIEESAAPIRSEEGNITGVVVVFRDFTDKKEKLDEIEYLSYHDYLTGLYNRRYMEDSVQRLDTLRNLPFTVMSIDVNGLKLTNDAFGHKMGDRLLVSCARMLESVCREDDIIGRMGGDEFMILLPRTSADEAKRIKERIEAAAKEIRLDSVIVSLALGFSTKYSTDVDIGMVITQSDNDMYKNKLKYGKLMRSQTIELLLKNINLKYDNEQIHTERVSQYCVAIAKEMGLSEREVAKVNTAAVLHDIGKIMVPPEILNKPGRLTEDEYEVIKKHPETGYQILKSVDEYASLALNVLYHHERMDGTGYPEGLKGKKIPLVARIIGVTDAYEAMTGSRPYQRPKTKEAAIKELIRHSGTQFDAEVVKVFVEKILK